MNVRANDASIQDGEGTRTGRLSLSLMLCTCVFPRRLLRVETEREKGEGRNRLRWNARARSSTTSLTTTICSMSVCCIGEVDGKARLPVAKGNHLLLGLLIHWEYDTHAQVAFSLHSKSQVMLQGSCTFTVTITQF